MKYYGTGSMATSLGESVHTHLDNNQFKTVVFFNEYISFVHTLNTCEVYCIVALFIIYLITN